MRFLVDAQLPPALGRWLAEAGHEAKHVEDVGLRDAEDSPIWRYALENYSQFHWGDRYLARNVVLRIRNPVLPSESRSAYSSPFCLNLGNLGRLGNETAWKGG
jgi:hypothetical protein